jgi:hypothetical protein
VLSLLDGNTIEHLKLPQMEDAVDTVVLIAG